MRTNTDGIEYGRGEPSPIDFATTVDIGSGGNIMAGGIIDNVDALSNATVKYRSDGTRAATFDENGIVAGAGVELGPIDGLDIGPRGGIALVGDGGTDEEEVSAVAKLTRHGEPDPSFDSSELDGALAGYNGVTIADGGALFITGIATEPALAVVKATPHGQLDTSFGDGGVVVTPIDSAVADAVTVDGDGNVIVAGNAGANLLIARYGPDGSLDTSFDGDGIAEVPLGPSPLATDMTIDADGRMLVSATVRAPDHQLLHGSVVRLLADGSLDTSFADGGVFTVDPGGRVGNAWAVTVDSQDRVIVAGTVMDPETQRDFYAARLLPDGTADGAFGDGGVASADLSEGHIDEAYDVAADPDDNVVVAGSIDGFNGETYERAFGVARFTGSAG